MRRLQFPIRVVAPDFKDQDRNIPQNPYLRNLILTVKLNDLSGFCWILENQVMAVQAQMYQDGNWVLGDGNDCTFNGSDNLFFTLQQKQQQEQRQREFQMLQNQNQTLHSSNNNGVLASTLCLEKRRQEIDQYVRLQNERLRSVLREKRNNQIAAVIKEMEFKAQVVLERKDQEIAQAAKKTMELQSLLLKLEMEKQAWQRVARENEAVAVSLNNTLEQLKDQGFCSTSTKDAESCCGGDGGSRR